MRINKLDFKIVLILTVIFFYINLFFIYQRDFFVDEVIGFNLISKLSFKTILSGIDVHSPFYYILMKILPHNNIYLLRLYSLIIMTVSLYLLFCFTINLFDRKTAYITLIISSLSQTISYYGSDARMYPIIFLFSVLMFYSVIKEKYKLSITLLVAMIFTHYYSVFMFIPLLIVFLIRKRYDYIKYMSITIFLAILILSPYIYHQLTDNPYKINPPTEKAELISIPSMLIFPFINPTTVKTETMLLVSFLVIIVILYLIVTFRHERTDICYFFISSFITSLIILSLSFIKIPYHPRYLIMFFPMIYVMLSISILQKKQPIKVILLISISLFLISFISIHLNPDNQFMKLSEKINCPQNILHETPFSYLPMSIYLPDCKHYMAVSEYWKYMTNNTLYTAEHYINNRNVSYDIYIHYFDELRGKGLLENTNLTTLQLIRIE